MTSTTTALVSTASHKFFFIASVAWRKRTQTRVKWNSSSWLFVGSSVFHLARTKKKELKPSFTTFFVRNSLHNQMWIDIWIKVTFFCRLLGRSSKHYYSSLYTSVDFFIASMYCLKSTLFNTSHSSSSRSSPSPASRSPPSCLSWYTVQAMLRLKWLIEV